MNTRQQSALYSHLSLNIIREICKYLSSSYLLPVLHASSLSLYDLETKSSVNFTLQRSFTNGTVVCFYQERRLLCLGSSNPSKEVWAISVDTGDIVQLPPMKVARAWSGVVKFLDSVYVFGGNMSPLLQSCEAVDVREMQWRQLPDMRYPKFAFTPAISHKKIYLASATKTRCPFEVFDPANNTFQVLPISLLSHVFGCVCFFVGSTMELVTCDQELVTWKLGKTAKSTTPVCFKGHDVAISNTPPVVYRKQVWWVNYISGGVVCFDIAASKINESAFNSST